MTIIKKPFLAVIILIGVIVIAGCSNSPEGKPTTDTTNLPSNVNANKDEIVVITMTHCPECREMLKPYLDRVKSEYGSEIKEYQVSSPFDPAVNQILSENGLKRPVGGGMPIVCINENCFLRMDPIKIELNKFMEQER